VVISDATALLDLVGQANAWRKAVSEKKKKKKARRAAQLLSDAGILVAGMRTYDNEYRRVLRRMRLLQPEATEDERRQAAEELERFNETHVIVAYIDQSYYGVAAAVGDNKAYRPGVLTPVSDLMQCYDKFRNQIRLPIEEQKAQTGVFSDIRRALLYGESVEELRPALDFADAHLDYLSLKLLRDADRAFGTLRHDLVEKYDLPTPGWAVQLAAQEPSG
jgi:hypothetical protein